MPTTVTLYLEITVIKILALYPELSVHQAEAVLQHLEQHPYIPTHLLEHWINDVIHHVNHLH